MALFFVIVFNSNSTPHRCCVQQQLLMGNCRNVLWKSNIVEMSYHVEKSISLNGIVATFNSTNIYKIIENRCSSKKCYFEPFYNLKSFIHNGASGRVAEVGQSGSVANFFWRGGQHNTAQNFHHSFLYLIFYAQWTKLSWTKPVLNTIKKRETICMISLKKLWIR